MQDHEIIEWAKRAYESGSGDNIIIQETTPIIPIDQVVDRLDDEGGAWVMAWVYVPIEQTEDTDGQ